MAHESKIWIQLDATRGDVAIFHAQRHRPDAAERIENVVRFAELEMVCDV